jgi:hypothetical protein
VQVRTGSLLRVPMLYVDLVISFSRGEKHAVFSVSLSEWLYRLVFVLGSVENFLFLALALEKSTLFCKLWFVRLLVWFAKVCA